jgi:penicillin amidase
LATLLQTGLSWLVRTRLAQTHGSLRLPGLHAPVEIIRDRWGVPHFYAASTTDALFAQGFVHAQDRLWQMEFQRRLVAGRLAEVLGVAALPVDRWMRTLTMRRVAEAEVALIAPEVRSEIDAYVAGVNAFLARGRLPVEFTLLRYRPEPWTAADSLSWAKMMAWSLSVNWETEILRAQLIARLGPERAAELESGSPDRCPTILPGGLRDAVDLGQVALDRAEAARLFVGPAAQAGLGSNNWVIGGALTITGKPLLANDMHLLMGIPAIWYENHLVAQTADGAPPALEVTGVTFPGVPYVVAGHNARVAWGFTNGFPDVQDLYMEHLRRTEDGRVQYEFRGEWLDAEVHREEVRVKGAAPVIEEVVITRHGPVISALAPDFAGDGSANLTASQPLALRWTSLDPSRIIHALYAMNRAPDCLAFREALREWAGPVQNVVYADTDGNIGYSFPGLIPIRARGDGRVPAPGWTGEYEWTGYIPFEELPHAYNPPQGYVATANNRVVGDEYPHFLGRDFTLGDRAQRIVELIEAQRHAIPAGGRVDVAYIRRMQFDQVSPSARLVAAHLGRLAADDPELAAVIGLLRDWDGTLSADSPAAAVYQVFMRRVIALMLAEKLGDDLARRYAGKGPTPALAAASMFGHRSWEWLLKILDEPDSHWFDLGHGEQRDDVLRLALRQAIDFLKERLGPQPNDWCWGKLHRLSYQHIVGRVPALAPVFSRGPYPLGGDGTTIWATGSGMHTLDSDQVIGPPFRHIADLGDWGRSLGLLAPGNSGQPGSRHYDDQIDAWFEGGYHPLLFTREEVEREGEARLRLVPG